MERHRFVRVGDELCRFGWNPNSYSDCEQDRGCMEQKAGAESIPFSRRAYLYKLWDCGGTGRSAMWQFMNGCQSPTLHIRCFIRKVLSVCLPHDDSMLL